jgi:hypothetical protein
MAWEWFTLIGSLPELLRELGRKTRTNNATKKLLLSELRNNLKHFNTAEKNQFSPQQLVSILSNTEILAARHSGFDFGKIRKGHIIASEDKRNSKYLSKDCEWMFLNISDKIVELKAIYSLQPFPDLSHSNIQLQLSNLFYKMKLLAEFINKGPESDK